MINRLKALKWLNFQSRKSEEEDEDEYENKEEQKGVRELIELPLLLDLSFGENSEDEEYGEMLFAKIGNFHLHWTTCAAYFFMIVDWLCLEKVSKSAYDVFTHLSSGGSRGYASSKKEGEKVIKRWLSDSFFSF